MISLDYFSKYARFFVSVELAKTERFCEFMEYFDECLMFEGEDKIDMCWDIAKKIVSYP